MARIQLLGTNPIFFPDFDGKPYTLSFTMCKNGVTLRGEFHYDSLEEAQRRMMRLTKNMKRLTCGLDLRGKMIIEN